MFWLVLLLSPLEQVRACPPNFSLRFALTKLVFSVQASVTVTFGAFR